MDNSRIEEILKESFINEYLMDEGITDIRFNGTSLRLQHNELGRYKADKQPSIQDVKSLIKKITDIQNKKELTNTNPIMDTEIGFLRVNSVHAELSPDGQSFAIRVSRPRLAVSSVKDFTATRSEDLEQLLKVLVLANCNMTITGRTGAGKTEIQKLLVGFIDDDEIIALIEDTRDSHIKTLYPNKDIISWVTKKDEGFTSQKMLQAALRNNPDWVIQAETRGEEAADVLDCSKTDHSIITTLHVRGAMNTPKRFMSMVRQAPAYANMSDILLGTEIIEELPFGMYTKYENKNGVATRHIKELVEFTGYTTTGATGTYLYKVRNVYNEKTNSYSQKEYFNPLSEATIEMLKDKEVYHLLPDIFKPKSESVVESGVIS